MQYRTVSCISFPRNENAFRLWKEILQINREGLPTNCSIHFPVDAIDKTGTFVRLKPNVLPIKFVPPQVCMRKMGSLFIR